MQIDNYTKFIMTVIAGALVVIALKGTGIISTANAKEDAIHKIAICEPMTNKCASVSRVGELFIFNHGR